MALVANWSIGLLKQTSKLLLDAQAEPEITQAIREKMEGGGGAVMSDLHVWHIGPGIYSVIMVIDDSSPKPVEFYKLS